MTYRELLREGTGILKEKGIADHDTDARLLLEHVCGAGREFLLLHGEEEIDEVYITHFKELIKKRTEHIPLQHLTGTQEFMGLPFEVGPSVLIPRQETEILVEEALKDLHSGMRILDLCTGSGCILLSLLRYSHECTGVGIDISEEALALAKKNGDAILGEDAPVRSAFFRSDLFEKVEGTFDLVISNPPYIPEAVIDTLEPEVALHDPRIALEGGKDGLSFYRRIIEDLHRFLKPGGTVLFEIGHDQGEAVSKLLQDRGYKYTEVLKDLSGLDRVVKAHRSVL